MGQVTTKEKDSFDFQKFLGVWYDIAGYPNVDYAYNKIELTSTGSITIDEYDHTGSLIDQSNGIAEYQGDYKVKITLTTSQGNLSNILEIVKVEYKSLAIILREDQSEIRILSRNKQVTLNQVRYIYNKLIDLNIETSRISLDESVIIV